MDKWFEILVEIISFLLVSYFLFYRSFMKSLGNETAKLITRKDLISIEENVKRDFNEKLEELKSSLAKENISHQIEFEFLHRRKAEVAIEIYQKLQELYYSAYDRTRKIHLVLEDANKEERTRRERLNNAIEEFRDYFIKNQLYFSKRFCRDINEILRDFWRMTQEYNFKQESIRSGTLDSEDMTEYLELLDKISNEITTKIPVQLSKIENQIRKILKIEE